MDGRPSDGEHYGQMLAYTFLKGQWYTDPKCGTYQ